MADDFSPDFRFEARRLLRCLAREILRTHDSLFDAHDIEPVHRMRVTINKLRVALAQFGRAVPAGDAAHLVEDLRWLKDKLAESRDYDVMLTTMARLGSPSDEERGTGVQFIQNSFRADRLAAGQALTESLSSKRYAGFRNRLRQFARELKRDKETRPDRELKFKQRSDFRAPRIVRRLHDRYEKLRLTLEETFSSEAIHEYRIAAKKLRYAMDFFRPLRPEPYLFLSETLQELHDSAGLLHDLDVMAPRIEGLLARRSMEAEEEEIDRLEPGVAWLLERVHTSRVTALRRFCSVWRALGSDGVAARWAEAVRAADEAVVHHVHHGGARPSEAHIA